MSATLLPSGEKIEEPGFVFPEKEELKTRLKDILEDSVDEKYYLTDTQTKRLRESTFGTNNWQSRVQSGDTARTLLARDYKDPKCVRVGGIYDKGNKRHQAGSVYHTDGIAATLSTMQGGNQEPIIVASRGRGENNEQHLESRKDNLTNTITSVQKDNYVAEPMRIRKLTPKECWRLMGFDDEDFEKAKASGVSNSQLYKQAGNSIVVNVLEGILRNLLS